MILVIAGKDDMHSKKVMDCLRNRGAESMLVDFQQFPNETEIGFEKSQECHEVKITCQGREINMSDVNSVLYRRPKIPQISSINDSAIKEYVVSESLAMLESLPQISSTFWVSDPDAIRIASRKPHQLSVANEVGLLIPNTVIGNSSKAVDAFVNSRSGRIAAKPLGKSYIYFDKTDGPMASYTQKLTRDEVQSRVNRIKNCPLIFQEYVEKEFELRITVVGNKVFACAIYSQNNDRTKIDWRRYDIPNTPHKVYELPKEMTQKCAALVEKMDLKFGCIDMIVTPKEEYVFLEINPAGQWLWIEELTGLPITETLAEFLIHSQG